MKHMGYAMFYLFRLPILIFVIVQCSFVLVGCRNFVDGQNDQFVYFWPQKIIVDEKVGYIDPNGHICIPPVFYYGEKFIDGKAIVQKDKDSPAFLVDTDGNEICKLPLLEEHELYLSFHNGNFVTTNFTTPTYKFRVFSPSADRSASYERAHGFYQEDRLGVKRNGKWGFLNDSGRLVIDYQFEFVWPFSEGLAAVQKDDKWGYIRRDGTWAIKPKYIIACSFSEGIAYVKEESKNGPVTNAIDTQGQSVMRDNQLLDIVRHFGEYSEGLSWFTYDETGKGSYMDRNGNIIISGANISDGRPFVYGLAAVAVEKNGEEQWGIINKAGTFIVEPKNYAVTACDGSPLYAVKEKEHNEVVYVNLQGKVVWPPPRRGESL